MRYSANIHSFTPTKFYDTTGDRKKFFTALYRARESSASEDAGSGPRMLPFAPATVQIIGKVAIYEHL